MSFGRYKGLEPVSSTPEKNCVRTLLDLTSHISFSTARWGGQSFPI